MNWFDAVTHSFATMGTGRLFPTKENTSISGGFANPAAEWVISLLFMLLASGNFSLYCQAVDFEAQEALE